MDYYCYHLHLCTSLHLWTLLFCIYGLCYYYCCYTVCTALLFSYSAIFIAASVWNKLIHSSSRTRSLCTVRSSVSTRLQVEAVLTTRVLTHSVPVGARGSSAAARSQTFIFLSNTTHKPTDDELKRSRCVLTLLFMGNPSQSYGASPAIWDHTGLPAARHRWTRPALTPAMQPGTRFTYPGGMEGWVDLGGWLYTEMVYLSAEYNDNNIIKAIYTRRLKAKRHPSLIEQMCF